MSDSAKRLASVNPWDNAARRFVRPDRIGRGGRYPVSVLGNHAIVYDGFKLLRLPLNLLQGPCQKVPAAENYPRLLNSCWSRVWVGNRLTVNYQDLWDVMGQLPSASDLHLVRLGSNMFFPQHFHAAAEIFSLVGMPEVQVVCNDPDQPTMLWAGPVQVVLSPAHMIGTNPETVQYKEIEITIHQLRWLKDK